MSSISVPCSTALTQLTLRKQNSMIVMCNLGIITDGNLIKRESRWGQHCVYKPESQNIPVQTHNTHLCQIISEADRGLTIWGLWSLIWSPVFLNESAIISIQKTYISEVVRTILIMLSRVSLRPSLTGAYTDNKSL